MGERPRVIDNDKDEIFAILDGRAIRVWTYADDIERRLKMQGAREYAQGWSDCELENES